VRAAILHTVGYFSYFRHPLNAEEVWRFMSHKASLRETADCIEELCASGVLKSHNGLLHADTREDWSQRRRDREASAHKLLATVPRYVHIIASFPFVRGIAVSGSLSKLSASEHADIDYFIVTAHNRLWITRTLLHLFKKLTFLTGHQHSFCMNYFVDEAGLELPFRNEFTAIELVTLIPYYNRKWIDALKDRNRWVTRVLPNHDLKPLASPPCIEPQFVLKPFLEGLLNLAFPKTLNRWLMQLTDWKWRRKFAHLRLKEEDYQRAFYISLHTSKNHPADYQKKVLKAAVENELACAVEVVK